MKRVVSSSLAIVVTAALALGVTGCGGGGSSNKATPRPAAPTGVGASSQDSGEAIVTWTPVTGAATYNIYWGTSSGVTKATGMQIAGVTSPHLHTGLTDGTIYYYVATALAGARESTESTEISVLPVAAPTGVLATTALPSRITIDWSPVAGAISYYIYWSTLPGVTKATGTPIPEVTAPFVHTGLVNGTPYYYVVTALNPVGGGAESTESVEVSATPLEPPTGVLATGATSQVSIYWNPVAGVSSYNLYWSTAPGVTKATGTQIPGITTAPYPHNGLANGTTHHYVVTAVIGADESVESVEASATPLAAPTGVSAAAAAIDKVTVDWSPVTGATSYNLYWSDAPGVTKMTGMLIPGLTAPYLHMGLTTGQTYYYVVTATNLVGGGAESTESAEVSAIPGNFGILDFTFGGQGWVVHDSAAGGDSGDSGRAIALDASGRILVSGHSSNGTNFDMVIWRYDSTGVLDATFGVGGIVVHNDAAGGNLNDFGEGIALDASGRILVSGTSWNGSNRDMVTWRYDSTGVLDATFGVGGIVVHNDAAGGNLNDFGEAIALDASGRILVCGNSWNGANSDMVIWRYDSSGVLDATFGVGGVVVHDNAAGGNSDDGGRAIAVDASGRILVSGTSWNGASRDMVTWRYDSAGVLDATFSLGGVVVHNDAAGGNLHDHGEAITLDASGRILVSGFSWNGANYDMVTWRHDSTGVLDATFGVGGVVAHNDAAGGNFNDYGEAIALDSSGRILVSGYSWNGAGNSDMVTWRYDSTGVLDATFGVGGVAVHNDAAGGDTDDQGWAIVLDNLDRVLVTGQSGNATFDTDMVIWRFN
ncbi:MAG: hypothetical protein O7H41_15030 [Planctomycetota bacterium]|nr:hypothetical protein [Planctomycetota bacterium]